MLNLFKAKSLRYHFKTWFGTNLDDLLNLEMHVLLALKMAHCFSIHWKKRFIFYWIYFIFRTFFFLQYYSNRILPFTSSVEYEIQS